MVRMGNNPSGSRPKFFGRQHLTFDKGRAWMPEVERPEFRKDAKQAESSYGKCGCARRGIVRFWEGLVRAQGWRRFWEGFEWWDGEMIIS